MGRDTHARWLQRLVRRLRWIGDSEERPGVMRGPHEEKTRGKKRADWEMATTKPKGMAWGKSERSASRSSARQPRGN